jgi:hypothetical protein
MPHNPEYPSEGEPRLNERQQEFLAGLPSDIAALIGLAWSNPDKETQPHEEGSPDTFPQEWLEAHGNHCDPDQQQ